MTRVVLVIGTTLGVGGLLVAAVTTTPRPRSVREVAYLAVPLAGVILIAALSWAHG